MADFTRLRLSLDTTKKLQILKWRVGLTPNILSRFALCYSLNDLSPIDPGSYDEDGQELNRYTLLGEWDVLYVGLVKQRICEEGLDLERDLYDQLRAHINRGVISVYTRVKCLADLYNLLPQELRTLHKEDEKTDIS